MGMDRLRQQYALLAATDAATAEALSSYLIGHPIALNGPYHSSAALMEMIERRAPDVVVTTYRLKDGPLDPYTLRQAAPNALVVVVVPRESQEALAWVSKAIGHSIYNFVWAERSGQIDQTDFTLKLSRPMTYNEVQELHRRDTPAPSPAHPARAVPERRQAPVAAPAPERTVSLEELRRSEPLEELGVAAPDELGGGSTPEAAPDSGGEEDAPLIEDVTVDIGAVAEAESQAEDVPVLEAAPVSEPAKPAPAPDTTMPPASARATPLPRPPARTRPAPPSEPTPSPPAEPRRLPRLANRPVLQAPERARRTPGPLMAFRQADPADPAPSQVVVAVSGKGGAGRTTAVVAAAHLFAKRGIKTVVLDATTSGYASAAFWLCGDALDPIGESGRPPGRSVTRQMLGTAPIDVATLCGVSKPAAEVDLGRMADWVVWARAAYHNVLIDTGLDSRDPAAQVAIQAATTVWVVTEASAAGTEATTQYLAWLEAEDLADPARILCLVRARSREDVKAVGERLRGYAWVHVPETEHARRLPEVFGESAPEQVVAPWRVATSFDPRGARRAHVGLP